MMVPSTVLWSTLIGPLQMCPASDPSLLPAPKQVSKIIQKQLLPSFCVPRIAKPSHSECLDFSKKHQALMSGCVHLCHLWHKPRACPVPVQHWQGHVLCAVQLSALTTHACMALPWPGAGLFEQNAAF